MAIDGFTEYAKEDRDRYNNRRWWLGMTWGDMFDKATDIYPDKVGLVDGVGQWTYTQLREKVDRLAISLIKLGIKPRDWVLMQFPNWHEYVITFFAMQKIGALTLLLIPRHNESEINHLCALTKPVAWVVPEQYGKIDYQPIVDDVLKENPQIKLNIMETSDPKDFNAPVFAHSPVGKNMDPISKCDAFAEYMTKGLGQKADVAFFKFCYIDILHATDVNKVFIGYKESIERARKSSPSATIIHITTPLRVVQTGPRVWVKKIIGRPIGGYDDNVKREQFNDLLRKEYSGKEPIFDLAGIESTSPDGSRVTFEKDGNIYPALVAAYTYDGGHLNELGRKVVAEQFLIFLSKI